MVKIMVGELKDKAKDLADFLTQKLGIKAELLGETIIVEGSTDATRPANVKTYLKRFLHLQNLRSKYRATLEKGEFRFREIVRESEEEAE